MTAVNAMFALGCEFSDHPPEEKEAAAAMFFERTRALMKMDLLENGSLAHVQALLLVGQYLTCTHYPTQCWNIVGFACRMAIGLGLQSSRNDAGLSDLELEVRRRTWYGCVQMDMTVSMTLGRPPSVYMTEEVPLPRAIDDEFLGLDRENASQPPDLPSQLLFTRHNIKCATVLGTILRTLYYPSVEARPAYQQLRSRRSPVSTVDEDLHSILQLDSQLEELANQVPEPLRWDRTDLPAGLDERGRILRRQTNVLHARYLHTKILLYRPSFTSFCAGAHAHPKEPAAESPKYRQPASLSNSLQFNTAVDCVRIACALVESVKNATIADVTGAWWFRVFYLLTCSVIIIIADCTPPLRRKLGSTMLDKAWDDCIEALSLIGQKSLRAESYLRSLQLLRQRSLAMVQNASRVRSRQPSTAYPTRPGTPMAPAQPSQQQHNRENEARLTPNDVVHSEPDNTAQGPAMNEQHQEQNAQQHPHDGEWTDSFDEFTDFDFDIPALLGSWEADLNDMHAGGHGAGPGLNSLGYSVSAFL
ncbi:fungal-specific transcription factor domain-containing protein [Microdochium trichocladiopsis]|uniref:Fungal-specific transcription factor domain-containing protein n=1 Tax=Microdochium trichocladiopsis TaxID=1682393 RepID=A0A9P9BR18_9PEZI|nr:fungal-specific transcription factor domain-containing protein [Microdochium trichocladiopsis]KAH7035473.1 fungal-specific transcription factor domain-containing protein [Microdochium trichocladiopsis]